MRVEEIQMMGRTPPTPDADGDHADILIHLREIQQLFNSMDPTPFPDRDLDDRAEEFITGWALEHPTHLPLRLIITLSQPSGDHHDSQSIQEAIQHYFAYRSQVLARQLRQLLSVGRMSLAVGLVCLGVSVGGAHLLGRVSDSAWLNILHESLIIGGWVAMWRPIQIFLYDWWPIRRMRVLCERLAVAEVQVKVLAPAGATPVT